MIRASSSGDSSSSKRIPFTVPAVPTGMKTGVSILLRPVVITPARASPSRARTWKERLEAGDLRLDMSAFANRFGEPPQHLANRFQVFQYFAAQFAREIVQVRT